MMIFGQFIPPGAILGGGFALIGCVGAVLGSMFGGIK